MIINQTLTDMVPCKTHPFLFSLLVLCLLVQLDGFGQCLCDFEQGSDQEGYTTINIFSTDQQNYGLVENLQYKVVRDTAQGNNAYFIEVMLDQTTHRYSVAQQQLFYEERRLGHMSNLRIGLTKIASHLLSAQCKQASQMQPSQKQILFPTAS